MPSMPLFRGGLQVSTNLVVIVVAVTNGKRTKKPCSESDLGDYLLISQNHRSAQLGCKFCRSELLHQGEREIKGGAGSLAGDEFSVGDYLLVCFDLERLQLRMDRGMGGELVVQKALMSL